VIDQQARKAEYGIGGGIVWDSTDGDEYAEALLKARILTEAVPSFSLLETILWTPEDGFFLRDKHLERLLDSASYFDIPASRKTIEAQLDRVSFAYIQPQRVRLLVAQNGSITISSTPLAREKKNIRVTLADTPVNSNDIFLFHKTTRREVYEDARAKQPDCDDVLLFNERGELTEFTIGNLVLELDGELVTPPLLCGVLPGTFRDYLLETGKIVERAVPLHRLKECGKIYRVNSVRKWETVRIQ
jgi:para-aminobenzoate synthetase/4-amino-4-deoxychorismate lyase